MASQLARAPLIYTLVQVKFETVLAMEKYIPEIQDRMRSEYPRYKELKASGIRLGPNGPEAIEGNKRWTFSNKANSSGFLLLNDTFAFHVTEYSIFNDFLAQARKALEVVNEIVNLSLVERIGMRHIDVVTLNDNEPASEYLKPELLGFNSKLFDSTRRETLFRTTAKSGIGTLLIHCLQSSDGAYMPSDLMPCELDVKTPSSDNQSTILLDSDHYCENLSLDFDIESVSKKIDDLHKTLSKVFKTAFTDKAYEQWK